MFTLVPEWCMTVACIKFEKDFKYINIHNMFYVVLQFELRPVFCSDFSRCYFKQTLAVTLS